MPKQVKTPIGLVRIVQLHNQIPQGWRKLKIEQGKGIKFYLETILGQWSVIAFQKGRMNGDGYPSQFREDHGKDCKQQFIINQNQKLVV